MHDAEVVAVRTHSGDRQRRIDVDGVEELIAERPHEVHAHGESRRQLATGTDTQRSARRRVDCRCRDRQARFRGGNGAARVRIRIPRIQHGHRRRARGIADIAGYVVEPLIVVDAEPATDDGSRARGWCPRETEPGREVVEILRHVDRFGFREHRFRVEAHAKGQRQSIVHTPRVLGERGIQLVLPRVVPVADRARVLERIRRAIVRIEGQIRSEGEGAVLVAQEVGVLIVQLDIPARLQLVPADRVRQRVDELVPRRRPALRHVIRLAEIDRRTADAHAGWVGVAVDEVEGVQRANENPRLVDGV